MSQANTNSLPMPRVRPRILAMLTTGVDERRSTNSRQRPSTSGCAAALPTSRWATKKSGFADSNTTTFTDGSASMSANSVPNSTIVAGTNMLIGGLLNVIAHRPGSVRSMLNCERLGCTAHLLLSVLRPQRSEARAKLFRKELRLFPGRKVPALGQLVVVD